MPHNEDTTGFLTAVQDRLRSVVVTEVADRLVGIDDELEPFAQVCLTAATSGGKRLRPRFAFCAWQLGAVDRSSTRAVVQLSSALELLHAAILVHDDIVDGSELRRGRPAARTVLADRHRQQRWWGDASSFGDETALIVGDLLWSAAHDEFGKATAGLDPALHHRITETFRSLRVEVLAGQLLELRAQSARDFRGGTAEKILQYKTASYTVVRPIELGLMLSGADSEDLAAPLGRYASAVGQAFQLRDDLSDLFGSVASSGKRIGDDIRTGKPTELLGTALALADDGDLTILEKTVGDLSADEHDIGEIQRIALRSGAAQRIRRRIDDLAAGADRALDELPGAADPAVVRSLRELLVECTEVSFLVAGGDSH